jgi:hypothetical protein
LWVQREIDAWMFDAQIQELIAKWQPDGVEAGSADLVQHVIDVARLKSDRRKSARLHA